MIGIADRWELLAEAVPQLIWITDADGSVEYVNRFYIDYTGYALEALCGQTAWRKALHPDDLERCLRDWQTATSTGVGFETEYRLRRASDATWRWHLARALPFRDASGCVVKWVGSCTDIEEQKLLHESLRLSQERILEESRRKDEFLAMLGHELRNPLAPILGAVSILRVRDPEAGSAHLDIIERQARHMARLVDDLLDVARITRGHVTLRTEPMELATVVERAIETATPGLRERGHTLVVDVLREGLVVDVDPIRLAQVIGNLLNNAAKYTPRAGTVTVRATHDGGDAVLSVRDNGIGIATEHLPHVFDLFVQGERTLDRSQGGLGVGLTLVHRLVEMHAGNVAAFSDGPGRGSEFVVRLPMSSRPLAGNELAPTAHTAAVPDRPRVLVVDDNQDIITVLHDFLIWKGFDIHVAIDGPSALAMAAEVEPDIVLLDIGPPKLDGYEVARRIRADPKFARTRLIALTGYGQRADLERAIAAGFHDHLVKPLDFEKLVGLLSSRCPSQRDESKASSASKTFWGP